ncbi:protein starmaker-like isoform X1 [Mercenaria mercenaria]|uniref:protein starmaker-like isoform X1 n=1 Tax=Mercenaria mercenaria TaxID=6596 RepID=UPI00234F385D|nr:protein starmaker-like isoform X1 [Mercenaria mercenaria]
MSRKRKLLEGPDDISPDLDFEKCKPYKGDRRKGIGTPKKRAKKALVDVDDSVKEAMSESEEQLAKLTLDCSGDTRSGVGETESVNSDGNTESAEKATTDNEVSEGGKALSVGSQKENMKSVLKSSNKSKREDKCNTEILTSITVETNTQVRNGESDINGASQTEKDSSSSKQSSTQVSPGSGSISLSLFQPLNSVVVEPANETVNTDDKLSDKKNDNTFEFPSEDTSKVTLKKARGRPKGSKNKVANEKAGSSKSKVNESKTDEEIKTSLVVSKKHPGLKSPKANKTAKKPETKTETPSKKGMSKAKLTNDSNKVISTDKVKPVNGEKVKRKYVRKNKVGQADETGRETKRPKKETNAIEVSKDSENVPLVSEEVKQSLDVNYKNSDIDPVSDSVGKQSKELSEKEPQKQSEGDTDNAQSKAIEKVNNADQEKQVSVNSISLQEPVTPLYGETPKVNESNQGLPCSPNMESFDDGGRLVIDTSVNNDDMDGAETKDKSDKTAVKCNKTQSNGAITENINVKSGDFVSNRALSKDIFRNGFGIYDGKQSMNNSDIPNAHMEQYRQAVNSLSPTNALNMLGVFSPPPMSAHVHIGHVTGNTNSYTSHDQNFDQPLDLTNNGAREEYTKGKIFKTKMLKKTYPKQENVQCFKEKSTSSVNQIPL